ncbi:MAG: FAD-binding and (Fe-S)-binding domain-containing protein [Arenicella sp.]
MQQQTEQYTSLAIALKQVGFQGDFSCDWSALAAATADNSVYQITPQAILSPYNTEDLVLAMQVLNQAEFSALPLTARGGATGTNGQSLNTGIIVDFKRYMHDVLAVDVVNKEALIEPGVVLESINERLKEHGLFFAPHTSSGSRCTIGGMIATDASGKGSRVYGKTGDNLIAIKVVLANGECLDLMPLSDQDLTLPQNGLLKSACDICSQAAPELEQRLPKLTRHFVGYDLVGANKPEGFDPVKLFAGSEGTLGMVTQARLKLLDIPKHKRLVLIGYDSFYAALQSATLLLKHEPTAVETIDDHIQTLAHRYGIAERLPLALRTPMDNGQVPICNFVEYAGDDLELITERIEALIADLQQTDAVLAWHIAQNDQEIEQLWNIRKLSAGLLGRTKGKRTPIPFIEDCVVGAEKIADFAMEFRALLDAEGVEYGMYGHVDVGCLHIRPALDMQDNEDQIRFKRISDNVLALVDKYDGIFWGEHGKGVRGQYLPRFVGDKAYQAFAEIKKLFDPDNRMNPGKLVTPDGDESALWQIDKTPFRAHKRLQSDGQADPFHDAFRCNGNALCQSYSKATTMCPSYKATGDVRHSPKGRADLLRHWRELYSHNKSEATAIEPQVYEALDGCLGCKACSTSCPVQVDIPELKARFFEHYFAQRKRPVQHLLIANLEKFSVLGQKMPRVLNAVLTSGLSKKIMHHSFGLRDLPPFSTVLSKQGEQKLFSVSKLKRLQNQLTDRTVLLLADSFNLAFDHQTLLDVKTALQKLGYSVFITEYKAAGKPLHVLGERRKFAKVAQRYSLYLRELSALGFPIVAVEPTHVALLRQEYSQYNPMNPIPEVLTVPQFLGQEIENENAAQWPVQQRQLSALSTTLMLHCTERSLFPDAEKQWKRFFDYIGIDIFIPELGCCGMAGVYGHDVNNYENSKALFDMGWAESCHSATENNKITATGFSCRSQVKRLSPYDIQHPLSLIA